ncbi:hypothetical protein [Brevundimonas sp.]|uniref:hypothetical protein n=1 Tax=Brevundimonas sp. TaxID=1871086 RepID=UPI00248A5EB9|nr:hypothetical protein [Brevundimonas sp.]MDI1280765.1 hypothetical protein [Brevundimonas sp.]
MCHFITLVASTDDVAALDARMRTHGRRALASRNVSIEAILTPGEYQYLSTSTCDCGTVFAPTLPPKEPVDRAAALRRNGWSEAKIGRAMAAATEASEKKPFEPLDSINLWRAILLDLLYGMKLKSVGILVHAYQGSIATERFDTSRTEVRAASLDEALMNLGEDRLMTVSP